jgi:hypothetical protein
VFGGLLVLRGILTIGVVIVIIRKLNVKVRRTLRIVARLLVSGVGVLGICIV